MTARHRFFVTAAKGTEGALRDELRALRVGPVRADRGGVHLEGSFEAGMKACLWSRIGMRVLQELAVGPAEGADGLYDAVRAVPWEEHLTGRSTFAVEATIRSSSLTHSHFVALRAKDAIVDRLRETRGERPDVDTRRPDVRVVIHLARDVATIALDLAGEPLHKRGWRVEAAEAPLRETLAAAVLALGGYDPVLPLLDPMCGSGTIAIEAALVARRIAPGRGRHFGFHRWPSFDADREAAFKRLQEEARETALPKAPAPILARDRFAEPLELARRNAERAGVSGSIEFGVQDARDLAPLPERCQIVSNPPYGERLGQKRLQLEGLFRQLGDAFRALPPGHRIVLLSGLLGLERLLDLRPVKKHPLFNGPLEVNLLAFETGT
jgi:putative N6-adenine-specific DNA methylase